MFKPQMFTHLADIIAYMLHYGLLTLEDEAAMSESEIYAFYDYVRGVRCPTHKVIG